MSHKEFLDGIEEEAKEYSEPSWKRPLIIVIAIFLLFLITGYYLVYSDALIGIVKSKTAKDNVMHANGLSVVFQNNTLELLQQEYVGNEEREIKACLFGEIGSNEYRVQRIEFPKVISASVAHIQTPGCSDDAIIDLHSHPINRCVPSQQDMRNLALNRQTNPELIMMIMCWKNRFSVTV